MELFKIEKLSNKENLDSLGWNLVLKCGAVTTRSLLAICLN